MHRPVVASFAEMAFKDGRLPDGVFAAPQLHPGSIPARLRASVPAAPSHCPACPEPKPARKSAARASDQ